MAGELYIICSISSLSNFPSYRLDELSGQLSMNGRIREGQYTFKVRVYDVVHKREVISDVTVRFKDISDDAVFNSGSIRLSGQCLRPYII